MLSHFSDWRNFITQITKGIQYNADGAGLFWGWEYDPRITQYARSNIRQSEPWLVALPSVLPSVCIFQPSPSCLLLSLLIHSFIIIFVLLFSPSPLLIYKLCLGHLKPGPDLINHWRPEFANSILSTLSILRQ